jgi:hypothetical protein
MSLSQCDEKMVTMSRRNKLWHRIRGAVDGYAIGIVRMIGESYSAETVQQAWLEFTVGAGEAFNGDDPHTELFFSWLFHHWSPSREKGNTVDDSSLYGVSPTRAYLNRRSAQLNPLLRRYLETCLATSPGFYEVFNCKPCVGFQARDVVTGRECEVSENLASTSLSDGEIMFAHLVPIDGTTLLEAISPLSFPPEFKRRLVQLARTRSFGECGSNDLREVYFVLARPRLPKPPPRIN